MTRPSQKLIDKWEAKLKKSPKKKKPKPKRNYWLEVIDDESVLRTKITMKKPDYEEGEFHGPFDSLGKVRREAMFWQEQKKKELARLVKLGNREPSPPTY